MKRWAVQAMNLREAREMLAASQERPDLIAQIVPSPLTLHFDNTIQNIIYQGCNLGDLLYIQVILVLIFLGIWFTKKNL